MRGTMMLGIANYLQAFLRERIQPLAAGVDMRINLRQHALFPEALDVLGNLRYRLIVLAMAECPADLVGHRDQPGHRVAHFAATAEIRRAAPLWVWQSRCQSLGPFVGEICTAVTLYSGQLVAQSGFSVVTTLACVSGWWKVVYRTPGATRSVTLARSVVSPARLAC